MQVYEPWNWVLVSRWGSEVLEVASGVMSTGGSVLC